MVYLDKIGQTCTLHTVIQKQCSQKGFLEYYSIYLTNLTMFIDGDCNFVNLLNDATVTYNNNIYSTLNMTRNEASNNPNKLGYSVSFRKIKPKVGDLVMNADKHRILSN